ncbi:type II secretion system protein GspD [Marinitoga sp. 1138]|uniref:type II secretion system protein GspD n=1 Tax=Marinitoga sp. 1138 TaxID=1643334 RepID=UPI001585DCEA|nr:hypothetical protein [Marinitoga sp. 1138]NUU97892.1 hypothetical protein [Marinitoga sp. 1138]
MKKLYIPFILFLMMYINLFSYKIIIDQVENTTIIKITNILTSLEMFNRENIYKCIFSDNIKFEDKTMEIYHGPVKKIHTYNNIIEFETIFPVNKGDIKINKLDNKNLEIIVKGFGEIGDKDYYFKKILIKDILEMVLDEVKLNRYYIDPVPEKYISLTLKKFYPEDIFRILIQKSGLKYFYIDENNILFSKLNIEKTAFPIIVRENNANTKKEEYIYSLIESNIPDFLGLIRFMGIKGIKVNENVYLIYATNEKTEQIKKINHAIEVIYPEKNGEIHLKKVEKNGENSAKMQKSDEIYKVDIIKSNYDLRKLEAFFDVEISQIATTLYLVKGEKIEKLKEILKKIENININYNNKKSNNINNKNNIKIEIIESKLDLLPFNKIFKDTIIQKIEKNYIIRGKEEDIGIIKDYIEKFENEEEISDESDEATDVKADISLLKQDIINKNKEKNETISLYKIIEKFAKEKNYSLINNDDLKAISVYNYNVDYSNKKNIEYLLNEYNYILEDKEGILIIKSKIPEVISIEISIIDSSILEETIRKIENRFNSKDIVASLNNGIITPQLYAEIIEAVFDVKNINSKSNSQLLSKPKIIVKSGSKAMFKSVYRVPIVNESSIQYIESGLFLEIEPRYNKYQDLIDLDLSLKVSEPEKFSISKYNAETSRELKTKMLIKNGYVGVIGGLKLLKKEKLNTGVPFLKDIPFLGELFKTTEERNREYNLTLFIWPKLTGYGGE